MKNTRKAMQLIKQLKLLQDEIFDSIMQEIDEIEPLKDVKPISPHMCVIKFSTIKENGFILSPEYYIQDVQKEEIKKYLSRCGKDIEKITARIEEMINTGKIKGNTSDKTVILNQSSLKALREIHSNLIS